MSSSSFWWPKAKLTHYLSPRFPPVFSRGDNCPYCATYFIPMTCVRIQLTLKIFGQSFFSVLSQLAMAPCMALMAPQIPPLNELVILGWPRAKLTHYPIHGYVGAA